MLLARRPPDRLATRWFADGNPMTVELAKCPDFSLGDLNVSPPLRTVAMGDVSIQLEPRVMQVLVLLAQNGKQPVDRDTMIKDCWGGVIVGDDAIQRCIGRLRRLAAELGGFKIETIPRIGYRLLSDSEVSLAESIASDADSPTLPKLALGKATYRGPRSNGGEFAELLSADISAALSINRDLIVLTGDSEIAPDFDAKIELREGNGLFRGYCSVVDHALNRIVWSDITELPEASAMIDAGIPGDDLVIDLSSRISAIVVREVTQASLAQDEALSAWQAVVRANAAYQRIDLDSLANAIKEGRRAVALDQGYAAAHAALANALGAHYELGGALADEEASEARKHCDLALAFAPEDPTVLAWTAHALLMITRPAEGLSLAKRAVEIDPSHPIANLYLARHYLHHGEAEKAEKSLDDHTRVAPLFPWKYWPLFLRGLARFMLGDVSGAELHLREASSLNPVYPYNWISLAVLGALKEDGELMRNAATRLKELDGADQLDLQLARIAHSYPDPYQARMIQNALRRAWMAQ